MSKAFSFALVLAAGAATPASADPVRVGALICDVSASIAMIVMQQQDIVCAYTPENGGPEVGYKGRIVSYGPSFGAVMRGKLAWGVMAPSHAPAISLAGSYSGVGAQASVGGGVGVNLLEGDTNSGFQLQPLSAEGHVGVNAAVGITRLTLRQVEARPRRFWDRWDD
jgi:hypothetical protein